MKIKSVDHLVLTVNSIDRSCKFYTSILGMEKVVYANNRVALKFGTQKINLHEEGKEHQPHAVTPMPGSADICFLSDDPVEKWIDHLKSYGIELVEGPVERFGACGPLMSIYFRDQDNNLIELSNYTQKIPGINAEKAKSASAG